MANKWLTILPNVVLTPVITPVIEGLEPYFEKANLKAYVTSGLRTPEDQLRIIRGYLVKKRLDIVYPGAMTCLVTDKDAEGHFKWQMAWSNLLNVGVIINPCYPAVLLMDYSPKGHNRKGLIFNQTPHAKGTAFNIGGGGNGVEDEAVVIQKAIDDKLPGLRDFLKERENNAIHCNCVAITPKLG